MNYIKLVRPRIVPNRNRIESQANEIARKRSKAIEIALERLEGDSNALERNRIERVDHRRMVRLDYDRTTTIESTMVRLDYSRTTRTQSSNTIVDGRVEPHSNDSNAFDYGRVEPMRSTRSNANRRLEP